MNSNPLIEGSLALLVGNFVGAISDRLATIIDARIRLLENSKFGSDTVHVLDSILGLFLELGMISFGCRIATQAMPWITEDPAGLLLFGMGISSATPHFDSHIKAINQIFFDEKLYSKEGTKQSDLLENGPMPDEPGTSE